MRYMIIVKNDPKSENRMPDPAVFEAMGTFNQSLVDAGILLAAEGLTPSKDGAQVTNKAGKMSVKDGPFTEAKELVAGFWIIQAKSLDEGETVDVRRVAEMSDFEGVMPEDVMKQEEKMRDAIAGKAN